MQDQEAYLQLYQKLALLNKYRNLFRKDLSRFLSSLNQKFQPEGRSFVNGKYDQSKIRDEIQLIPLWLGDCKSNCDKLSVVCEFSFCFASEALSKPSETDPVDSKESSMDDGSNGDESTDILVEVEAPESVEKFLRGVENTAG